MSDNNIDQRLSQLEQGFVEMRSQQGSRLNQLEYLVGELSDIARLHQEGMRIVQSDMQSTRADMQSMQSEIRGLQITANRILERLEQHVSDGHGG
jgi:hypothetical protein